MVPFRGRDATCIAGVMVHASRRRRNRIEAGCEFEARSVGCRECRKVGSDFQIRSNFVVLRPVVKPGKQSPRL